MLEDLNIGAQVNIFARQFKILSYGNEFTRKRLSEVKQRSLAILKASSLNSLGLVLDHISKSGVTLVQLKSFTFDSRQASEFLGSYAADALGGPVVAFEIVGRDVHEVVRGMAPELVLLEDSSDEACAALFMNLNLQSSTNVGAERTALVIKPHCLQGGYAGEVVYRLQQEGFEVTAAKMLNLDRTAASVFLDAYISVLPDCDKRVDELTNGPCLALELSGPGVLSRLRDLCGPLDPVIARALFPETLRAIFGQDRVRNAVHCTDLPDDGGLECTFLFRTVETANSLKNGYDEAFYASNPEDLCRTTEQYEAIRRSHARDNNVSQKLFELETNSSKNWGI